MTTPDTSRWRRYNWPDGAVIYDLHTGDTHLLSPRSCELIDSDTPLDLDPETLRIHNPALYQLCKLGLIPTIAKP